MNSIFVLMTNMSGLEVPVYASTSKEVLQEKAETDKPALPISVNEWNSLKRKAISIQEKEQSEDIWDTPYSEIIYDRITTKYSMDTLDMAEEIYDYEMPSLEYSIVEIPVV